MKRLLMMLLCCALLVGCSNNNSEIQTTVSSQEIENTTTKSEKEDAEEKTIRNEETEPEIEFIDDFEKANFDKYNSYASENGLADTLIYIDGKPIEKIEDEGIFGFVTQQSDGNKWAVVISDTSEKDCGISGEMLHENIRFFGEYMGYSDVYNMPAMNVFTEKGYIQKKADSGKYETVWSFKDYVLGKVGNDKTKSSKSETSDNPDSNVLVISEYTLSDGIGWYTRHFMVLENKSNETVDISTSSLAYNENGSMVSAANASFDALGAGCTSIIYEAFETGEQIDHYDTEINVSPSKYYESVIQDLSFVQNDISGGAVFQVTNNGDNAAEFVEGYALFFSGEELVGYDSSYFTDGDSEIKPGKTISKQLTCRQNFDRIEFYMTGRR